MRRIVLVALFALLAPSWSAVADLHTDCKRNCPVPDPEDFTQFDGDGHGDAADACAQAYHRVGRPGSTSGSVSAVDTRDYYLLSLTAGETAVVQLLSLLDAKPLVHPAVNSRLDVDVNLYSPGCDAVVATGVERGLVVVGVLSDELTFTATTTGDHVVEVVFRSGVNVAVGLPTTQTCNPVCSRVMNIATGYWLQVS